MKSARNFSFLYLILAAAICRADVASDSFLKTFAAGKNTWKFSAVNLDLKTTAANGKSTSVSTQCSSDAVALTGTYPNVVFRLGTLNCNTKDEPVGLTLVKIFANSLDYNATHIPAGESDPNQFRLTLKGLPAYLSFKDAQSLNSLTRDNTVFMDLVAEERDPVLRGSTYYYMTVNLSKGQNSAKDSLHIALTIDDYTSGSGGKKTEVLLTTELDRVN